MRSISRFDQTMYSVEYVRADDPYQCWNQYHLTHRKWGARLRAFELKLTLGDFKKNWKVRIRPL